MAAARRRTAQGTGASSTFSLVTASCVVVGIDTIPFWGQRVAAMRARSASISASGVIGIVNGRTATAPAEFSVGTDMWVSLAGF